MLAFANFRPQTLALALLVPGEGEHKVMEYIRRASAMESWSPELRHCFYGLDADLIMLSLVTHQTHFRLLREKMSVRHARPGRKPKDPLQYAKYDYELLEVGLLREMIELTFRTKADTKYELERLVDDFVFICMLVGNDFLPQMPHLDIVDGSLDLMMSTYRELLPVMGGHITDKEQIHLPRLELLCRALATFEAPTASRQTGIYDREDSRCGDGEWGSCRDVGLWAERYRRRRVLGRSRDRRNSRDRVPNRGVLETYRRFFFLRVSKTNRILWFGG